MLVIFWIPTTNLSNFFKIDVQLQIQEICERALIFAKFTNILIKYVDHIAENLIIIH